MNGRVIQVVREAADAYYDGRMSSQEAYATIDRVANSAWNWYNGVLNETRQAFDKRIGERIDADVDSWGDNYLVRELTRLRDAGTHPDEDFFRMKFTGNGETKWLNVTPAQYDAILTALS